MKNIIKCYMSLLAIVIIITIFQIVLSKANTHKTEDTVNIHFGENTPCILAVKAKYGCWPWDSCAKLPSEN